jgi:hypothetical protein
VMRPVLVVNRRHTIMLAMINFYLLAQRSHEDLCVELMAVGFTGIAA